MAKLSLFDRRRRRVRSALRARASGKPRLSVHRSGKHIYAQLIDDAAGKTLVSASSLDKDLKKAGGIVDELGIDVLARPVNRQAGLARGARTKRGADTAPAAIEEREFRHGLLLLAFFAEDILAAILDALALIGLRLAPAADLGGELTDLLPVDA